MHLYNYIGYCSMLTDKNRLDGYVAALKEAVTPDSIVLDLGAGTGIFSILACDFGAKKVYSVEANHIINLLNEVIKQRGYESKIEIIQKLSTDIEFEEKANVIIFDLHGAFPLFESSIETIIDARKRLLTDDAVFIPKKETIYFALSQTEEIYNENITQYLKKYYGFNIPSAERLVLNHYFSATSTDEKLLSKPKVFAEIVYQTVDKTSFSKDFEWEILESGTVHGLRGWFVNNLTDEVSVSNTIEAEKTTYSQPFFPFEKEVKVNESDVVACRISATYENQDYIWSWKTNVFEKNDKSKIKASFEQTQSASIYLDPKIVIKKSEYFVPELNETARIDLFILNSFNGKKMQGDIADELLEKFPGKFASFKEALEYTFALSQNYSR